MAGSSQFVGGGFRTWSLKDGSGSFGSIVSEVGVTESLLSESVSGQDSWQDWSPFLEGRPGKRQRNQSFLFLFFWLFFLLLLFYFWWSCHFV